jgi:DNA ligase D-like protein (predicted 3'-phosphoesterase)
MNTALSRPHWDFRLELDNVLKSWAIPKRPPRKAGIKRLAIRVADHDLEYADFEGEIPSDEYGTGTAKIWDKGEHVLLERTKKTLKIELFGDLLKGIYILCKFPSAGEKAWLFFKTKQE